MMPPPEPLRATLDDAFHLAKGLIALLPPAYARPTDVELRARLWREMVRVHPELAAEAQDR